MYAGSTAPSGPWPLSLWIAAIAGRRAFLLAITSLMGIIKVPANGLVSGSGAAGAFAGNASQVVSGMAGASCP